MAISKVNVPVISTINANSVTATAAGTLYEAVVDLPTGVYSISCISTTNTTVDFFNGSTFLTSATTVGGSVSVNLGTAATKFRVYTNTGSNIVVTITKTANALPTTTLSGTLDTITSSTTYTQTGNAYAVLVGGGGNGQNGIYGGAGGGSGAVCAGLVTLTGSMAVVIGAGTTAGGTAAGGASTFNGWSAGGGGYGGTLTNGSYGAGGTATGATFNITGGNGGNGGANNAQQTILVYPFVKNGTTGGGGTYGGQPGAGSGIGTGGTGGASAGANGGAATGYGAGGGSCGGGGAGPGVSGAGTPGVLYVLRF